MAGLMGGGPGGLDFGAMLNNPQLMSMAQNLMQDQGMQNMMANLMQVCACNCFLFINS